jgi:hypothetical protein
MEPQKPFLNRIVENTLNRFNNTRVMQAIIKAGMSTSGMTTEEALAHLETVEERNRLGMGVLHITGAATLFFAMGEVISNNAMDYPWSEAAALAGYFLGLNITTQRKNEASLRSEEYTNANTEQNQA